MTGCVLFMWAFAPMLLDAVQLMQARPGRKHATRLTISRRQHEFLHQLSRRWMRQAELGRGIRLSSEEHDLLKIGIGELLSAKMMRDQCRKRTMHSIPVENTASNGTGEETEAFAPRSSRLSGMTPIPDTTGIALHGGDRSRRGRTRPALS
jgi:hypothetical protein